MADAVLPLRAAGWCIDPGTSQTVHCIHTFYFNNSRDGESINSLDSLLQCLTTVLVNKSFLISSLNIPWCIFRPIFRPISSCLISCYLGEKIKFHLVTISFQVVAESNKVPPNPCSEKPKMEEWSPGCLASPASTFY